MDRELTFAVHWRECPKSKAAFPYPHPRVSIDPWRQPTPGWVLPSSECWKLELGLSKTPNRFQPFLTIIRQYQPAPVNYWIIIMNTSLPYITVHIGITPSWYDQKPFATVQPIRVTATNRPSRSWHGQDTAWWGPLQRKNELVNSKPSSQLAWYVYYIDVYYIG